MSNQHRMFNVHRPQQTIDSTATIYTPFRGHY